jgi:predicted RNA-binding protein
MCEFKVFKKDKMVFEDAVYAKTDGKKVTVKNVLGISKVFEDCTIAEVDVGSERLLLAPIKK